MSKLGLFLFVFALFICCISAYSADPGAGGTVRVSREASALPDPGRKHYNRGHGGYYQQHHWPSNYGHPSYGGWGGYRKHGK